MTTILVDTVTLEFMNYWPSDISVPPVTIGPNPGIALETSFDPRILSASRDVDGNVILIEDPLKVQDKLKQTWADLRIERNSRLTASDWTQLPDTSVDKNAWATYRQALRDLPEQITDPTYVTWPMPPF